MYRYIWSTWSFWRWTYTLQSSRVDGFILCCPSFRHFNRNRVLWERRGLSLMAADTADERYQLPLGIPMYPNAAIYYYYYYWAGESSLLVGRHRPPGIHVCLPNQKTSDSSQIMALLNCLEFTSYNVLLCPRSSPYSLWFEPQLYGGIIRYVIFFKKKKTIVFQL